MIWGTYFDFKEWIQAKINDLSLVHIVGTWQTEWELQLGTDLALEARGAKMIQLLSIARLLSACWSPNIESDYLARKSL